MSFFLGCSSNFDDVNAQSSETSTELEKATGEPDPSAPLVATYASDFPMKSEGPFTIHIKATPTRPLKGLSLRIRSHSESKGISTSETETSEATQDITTELTATIDNLNELSIHELYVLGHYGHGGVFPLELQMLKSPGDNTINLRAENDTEEPVVVVDGPPDSSESGPADDGHDGEGR